MASASGSPFRTAVIAAVATLSLFWSGTAQAQTAAPLSAYVISDYGYPPADPRLVWLISDLMRFAPSRSLNLSLTKAASDLLGKDLRNGDGWGTVTDHLIAWEIPEPPNYLILKRSIFTSIIPGWDRIFVEGDIDWRLVSWGGVLIDDRPYDTTDEACNCIPAADNPEVSSAADATWLRDDDIVFGIEVNGEYRAYPRRIMEVREMVNDTLGGRSLGIPYCTLCGAAQAYFTDQLPCAAFNCVRLLWSRPTGAHGNVRTPRQPCCWNGTRWAAIPISAMAVMPMVRSFRLAM